MQINNRIRIWFFVALLVIFIGGVIHLFVLRFESGDVYPAYSSLRSDPLGTRIFYESLANLNNLAVRRNYRPLRASQLEPGTTVMYLGTQVESWEWISADFVKVLDRLSESGGRLILSFLPVKEKMAKSAKAEHLDETPFENDKSGSRSQSNTDDSRVIPRDEPNDDSTPEKPHAKKAGGRPDAKLPQNRFVPLKKYWGVGFEFNEAILSQDKPQPDLYAKSTIRGYPAVIGWHTNLYFDVLDSNWHVLYTCDGHPVMIARQFNQGSVVMSADSFFVSNEALWSDRHPDLLARLIGPHAKVVFDEAHLGIAKQPGVAVLIRKYRFQWLIAGLILLAILFVWKNSAYFVPPNDRKHAAASAVRSDQDAARGFIALLRRNIPTSDILPVCIREWQETIGKDRRHISEDKLERIHALLEKKSGLSKKRRDPIEAYKKIGRIISKGKSI